MKTSFLKFIALTSASLALVMSCSRGGSSPGPQNGAATGGGSGSASGSGSGSASGSGSGSASGSGSGSGSVIPNGRVNVTYWSLWGGNTSYPVFNGKTIQSIPMDLQDVDPSYNVIVVSFIIYTNNTYELSFKDPGSQGSSKYTPSKLKDMVATYHKNFPNHKVLVSVGGQYFTPQLTTKDENDKYAASVEGIINQYGFDGIDLDIEGGAMGNINADLFAQANQKIVNDNKNKGVDFWLTMAPEWPYIIQYSYGGYAGPWYTDFIKQYGLSNITYIWPQTYNQGPANGVFCKDCNPSSTPKNKSDPADTGIAQFIADLAWAACTPEGLAANSKSSPPLIQVIPPAKFVLGIPAAEGAAGGDIASRYYVSPSDITKAWSTIKSNGFSISGFMNWAADWDNTPYSYDGYVHTPWETGQAIQSTIGSN